MACLIVVLRGRRDVDREQDVAPPMQRVSEEVRHLCLAVRHKPGLSGRVRLVPTQSLQASPQRHQRRVDCHALPAEGQNLELMV